MRTPSSVDTTPRAADPVTAELRGRVLEWLYAATCEDERSSQTSLGWSEVGHPCPRYLAHRIAGTTPVNVRDNGNVAALGGTGMHHVRADRLRRLPRFAVEVPISYRGVSGTCDLYDTATRTVVDWKTAGSESMRKVLRDGLNPQHRVQINGYAAGLAATGRDVEQVAVVYLPSTGSLADAVVRCEAYDATVADEAVDRVEQLNATPPRDAPVKPGTWCTYCPFHRPGWAGDLNEACPGT